MAEQPNKDELQDNVLSVNTFMGFDRSRLLGNISSVVRTLTSNPAPLLRRGGEILGEVMDVALGRSEVEPDPRDKRFTDVAWKENPLYHRWLQLYLILGSGAHGLLEDLDLDPEVRRKAEFAVTLIESALAPTNALAGNPAALKHAFDTGGASLRRGLGHWITDLLENGGMPSMVDARPFKVGVNMAVTEGSVIFRNEVLELIQYRPTKASVYSRPLIVIPPQINKYYALDMAPGRSFVEYAVSTGQQVFMVSWKNPSKKHADWDLDTYVSAILEAVHVARSIAESEDVNLVGVCAGGITTASVLGHLANIGSEEVNSVTFIVTMFDLSHPSMISMFASDATIATAMKASQRKGVLSGRDLSRMFAWLRPNELVWNYWVNNYLMGEDPPAFDILAWNADTTNLPAALHHDFLRMYSANALMTPNSYEVLGAPVDLTKVTNDVYVIAGINDHIAPWKSSYKGVRAFGGDTTFVLSQSGHLQALINPPGNPKARYGTNDDYTGDAAGWYEDATEHQGSWWEHWAKWMDTRSGDKKRVKKRLGNDTYSPIAPAPGLYVRESDR